MEAAASAADVVAEEDRTTLASGWQLRVVSVLHSVTMCLIMDTGQQQIRKGQNNYWYSARMPYMVQWLQAYCTIANSPRV
jgi:hypothetical protein